MISCADVEKLRGMRAAERAVLSLYLPVPLDPARIRELAGPVIEGWVARRERELSEEIFGQLTAAGLRASLAAVNDGAVAHLLVAHEGMIPGFVCGRWGALSTGSDECPDWGTAAGAVPDLLEEMVQCTLDDDGQVTVIRDAPFGIAAKLRFPVTAERGRSLPKLPAEPGRKGSQPRSSAEWTRP